MKIAIDLDGTIANFSNASFKRVEELYGIKMTKADAYKPETAQLVWERMTPAQKSKYTDHRELYAEICEEGFFENLEPLPGAIKAVKELAKEHEIFFLTKVLNWDRSAPEKAVWLKRYFSTIEYATIMVDSVRAKHIVDVDIVIDDDARVLKGIGGIAICIAQPWNQLERKGFLLIANDMSEAVKIIQGIQLQMLSWDTYWGNK